MAAAKILFVFNLHYTVFSVSLHKVYLLPNMVCKISPQKGTIVKIVKNGKSTLSGVAQPLHPV